MVGWTLYVEQICWGRGIRVDGMVGTIGFLRGDALTKRMLANNAVHILIGNAVGFM